MMASTLTGISTNPMLVQGRVAKSAPLPIRPRSRVGLQSQGLAVGVKAVVLL